jgi:hypothetical protein
MKTFLVIGLLMLAILIVGVLLLIVSISSATQAPEPDELTAILPIRINPAIKVFGQQTATAAAETQAAIAVETEQAGK